MAQFYPKRRFVPADSLDVDDVNAVFSDVGSIVAGGLGEHNFEEAAFDASKDDISKPAFSRIDSSACAQWYSKKKSASPFWNWQFDVDNSALLGGYPGWADRAHHEADDDSDNPKPGVVKLVSAQNTWIPIDSMSVTFDTGRTESALIWAMASLQHSQDSIRLGSDSTDQSERSARIRRWVSSMGARYALRLDGAVIPETITGAADFTNDVVRAGHTVCRQFRPTSPGLKDDFEYEFPYAVAAPVVTRRREAIVADFILAVPPGTHTIDVVVDVVDSPVPVSFTNRELIVLQLLK